MRKVSRNVISIKTTIQALDSAYIAIRVTDEVIGSLKIETFQAVEGELCNRDQNLLRSKRPRWGHRNPVTGAKWSCLRARIIEGLH